jgi:tripartite-type tricarboxylate transporter receptor subunit TctC
MLPNVEAGQVRALGTTGAQRSPVAPGVPTIAEAGVPGYEATIWLGFMAPRGTPPEIITKVNAEIGRFVDQPEVRRAWEKQGASPMIMSPDAFGEYLRRDVEKWAKVINEAGIKAE